MTSVNAAWPLIEYSPARLRGATMLLNFAMLLLLIALYALCAALVRFCERLIGPQSGA